MDASADNGLSGNLTRQIESLQEAFQWLSDAPSLKELSARFVTILRDNHPSANILLGYRPPHGRAWQNPLNGGKELPLPEFPPPDEQSALAASCTADTSGLHLVHRLVDRSFLGIHLDSTSGPPSSADADGVSLRLLAHLFAIAYQSLLTRRNEKDLVFSLNHRVLQLNSLIDTGIEVSKLDQEVAPHILALQRAASLTNAARGRVTVSIGTRILENHEFPGGDFQHPSPAGESRLASSFDFGGKTYAFEIFDKESRTGVVPFDETDKLLLDALARQVQASLENRFLHAQSLEKQKIEQDIAVAASIQQRILPTELPSIEGYDLAGVNIPSKSVGGDYYDCIPLPGGRFALVIADVAGKGVPAALLVSSLHAYLNAYLEGSLALVDVTRRVNTAIHRASTDDKFITAFLGILAPETGVLEAVNAGHCTVYWRKMDGTVGELTQGGIPFGMLGIDFPYQSETVTLAPGDRLLLYTDGITEAQNEQSQLYDTEGSLKKFFASRTPDVARTFIADLIADVRTFAATAPQADDITALYLIRKPGSRAISGS